MKIEAPLPSAVPVGGEERQRYAAIRRVTLTAMACNTVLTVLQFVVGVMAHSQALVADAVHSLSDLMTDILVMFASKHGSRDADEDHPYGHGRFETVAAVLAGGLLIVVAAGIGYDALRRLFSPQLLLTPSVAALGVAVLAVLVKEGLYHYAIRVARRVRSNLLRASAWHHRSDSFSSIAVIIGVGGTLAGLSYMDAIAAMVVAVMIAKVGFELGWHSLRELVDTGLEADRVQAIRQAILDTSGVRALHLLRTRHMGGNALVDVHIQVEPRVSVSEGHQISETVRQKLIAEIDEVADVMVHIDPENDEAVKSCIHLPLRAELLTRLRGYWREIPEARQLGATTLHYLDGQVHIDLVLPLEAVGDMGRARALAARLAEAARGDQDIAVVNVRYE